MARKRVSKTAKKNTFFSSSRSEKAIIIYLEKLLPQLNEQSLLITLETAKSELKKLM